jgi:hypothetical protein
MSEERPDYTLQQVAAIVPCHERVLRRHMKVPGETPPFTWDDRSKVYRFPHSGVQEWLAVRAELRKRLRKPHLRWLPGSTASAKAAA